MASTNFGEQLITFQFNQGATSETFNRLFYKTLPKGIYDGAVLSKPNALVNRVSISPGTFMFVDPDYSALTDDSIPETLVSGMAIKVQTTVSITDIEVTSSAPYIVMWFDWQNVSGNYLDFDTVSFANLEDKHIVIGRGCFVGGVLQDTFDYTRRDEPALYRHEQKKDALRVLPDETGAHPKEVYVNAGEIVVNNRRIDWSGGYSPQFTDTPATEKRRDIVFMKEDGTLGVAFGTSTTGTPVAPQYPKNGVVLAEINRNANRTTVQGNEIVQVDPERHGSNNLIWGTGSNEVDSREIPIGSAINQTVTGGSDFSIAATVNVRDAIEDVVQNLYNGGGIGDDSIKSRHIDWGLTSAQVNAGDVPYSGTLSSTDVGSALDELDSGKLDTSGGTISGNLTVNQNLSTYITGDTVISNGSVTSTGVKDTITLKKSIFASLEVLIGTGDDAQVAIEAQPGGGVLTWFTIASVSASGTDARTVFMLNPGVYRIRVVSENASGSGREYNLRALGAYGTNNLSDAT